MPAKKPTSQALDYLDFLRHYVRELENTKDFHHAMIDSSHKLLERFDLRIERQKVLIGKLKQRLAKAKEKTNAG